MRISRKSTNILAAGVFILLGWAATLSAGTETVDRIVGKVNDSIITYSEVEERAAALHNRWKGDPSAVPSRNEFMQQALDLFIEEKLLIQEGKKKKLQVDEAQVDKAVKGIQAQNHLSDEALEQMLAHEGVTFEAYKNRIRDQIMLSQVRKTQFKNRVRIGKKQLKKYYRTHLKDFKTPTKIHARHIMFILDKNLPQSAKELKKEKAKEVLREIRLGADFNKMAQIYSEDVSASKGGDLGVLEEGKMLKVFQDAAFQLTAGEVSPIVETPYGLHIIKVDEKIPGKTLSFKEAENVIRQIILGKSLEKRYRRWIDELKKTAYVQTTLFKNPNKKKKRARNGIRQTASLSKRKLNARTKRLARRPAVKRKRAPARASSKKPVRQRTKQAKTKKDAEQKPLSLSTMERKLKQIKALKNQKKISESEYQKRKKQLLSQL
ncbi:MAG: peptidylprolyl isomerase [Nitrospinales bacterium]